MVHGNTGSWHGTVPYRSPVAFYYDQGACPDQAVTVSVNEHGMAINGTILRIAGSTTPFTSSTGGQLDSMVLTLNR